MTFISRTCITILKAKYFNKQFVDVHYLKDTMTNFSKMYFICDCCSFQCQMLIIKSLHLLGFFKLSLWTYSIRIPILSNHFHLRPASSIGILIYSSSMKSLAVLVSCTHNYIQISRYFAIYTFVLPILLLAGKQKQLFEVECFGLRLLGQQ